MAKLNCWEVLKCGREPNGTKIAELGACPATTDCACNGINSGYNAGRICWAVAGTFSGTEVQGIYAQKSASCMSCKFFAHVKTEEGSKFIAYRKGQT